jgi:hypothetical protein
MMGLVVVNALVGMALCCLGIRALVRRQAARAAVQNGMTLADVRPVLDGFAGIFLGGDNGFKAQAKEWCDLAHANGLRFHYGRAGTLAKLEHAMEIGADSADSAFPMWTKERLRTFTHHWQYRPQLSLPGAA